MKRRKFTGKVGRVRQVMKVCADLIDAVPNRDDNLIQKAVKVVSIAEIVLTHVEGEESAIEAFASRLGLTKKNSPQFVNLFFSTPIKDVFEQSQIQLNEHCQITKAVSEHLDGSLYFVERNYGFGVARDNDFFYEGDFKFSKVLQQLWDYFDNRINVRIGRRLSGKADLEYTTFPVSQDEVYGKAQKRIDAFVAKHRLMQVDGVSRTYLFVGSPGLGKSTQALRIASQVGKRILRLDANSLVEFQANEMAFLLGGLQPEVLVVDDVDKAGVKGDH